MLSVDVRRRLGSFRLDVRFEVGRELAVLFGRSGAGKSVTVRSVAGLMQPDGGRIVLNDRVLFEGAEGARPRLNLPPQARRTGYVPQSYALFPHMSAAQNVAYALKGLPQADADRRVRELIALVELSGHEAQRPAQLSGGQQQRVALARALARRPDALLLDEPLSALDAPTRAGLRGTLRDLQRHFQIPVLFVTHDLAEAYFMADRLAVYGDGRILQFAAPGEVLRHPASVRVAGLMGVKNILQGRVVEQAAGTLRVCVGQVELSAPPADAAVRGPNLSVLTDAASDGASDAVGRLSPSPSGSTATANTFALDRGETAATGGITSDLPSMREAAAMTGGGSSAKVEPGGPASAAAARRYAPGELVSLCVRPERIILVRPERLSPERENLLPGRIVGEMNDGTIAVLSFRLDGPRLTPERDYDLEIELPVYVYERLRLASQREWFVSLKRDAMHVIRGDPVV